MSKWWMLFVGCLLGLWLCTGCGMGEKTLQQVAPDNLPTTVSFSRHILPIMNLYCVSCHRSPTTGGECDEDRLNYGTYEGTKSCFSELVESVFQKNDMPPGAARRLSSYDKLLLLEWQKGGFQR